MKITDILTEQEIDEMNRRDFLKGAGVAAVAGAIGTGAYLNRGKSKFEGNDGVYVDQILSLYAARKQMVKEPDDIITTCKKLIQEYLNQNPKMKSIVNNEYKLIVSQMKPDDWATITRNQDSTIRNFQLFLKGEDPEFNPKQKDEFN